VKILLDTCVWFGVRNNLLAIGYDVVWTGDWLQDPGDEEILATAYHEGRILVTLDKDFGELVIVRKRPHCGILRLANLTRIQEPIVCMRVLTLYGNELVSGAIITAKLDRVRIRPAESNS